MPRAILDKEFDSYRAQFSDELGALGYQVMGWRLLNASDFGVLQLRPRTLFVALREEVAERFSWPGPVHTFKPATGGAELWRVAPTVGETLYDLMASRGWPGADEWRERANKIAPTIVGGSRKHGGPDLGPTRAKRQWDEMGVNGRLLAN